MIDLTPVDVRKKKGDFRRTLRGYDPELVDDFLDLVADRLDQLVRESIALNERAIRQDRDITEYRERERALTEALVTAQEMREEIRKQTARDADVIRQEAEAVRQEAEAVRQEANRLRSAAQQEVAELRTNVEEEFARMRALAEEEAAQLRSAAERDTLELRTTVREEREREEAAVRQLRQRQRELLRGYRALLEQELAELGALAGTLGLPAGAVAAAAVAADPGQAGPEQDPAPPYVPSELPDPAASGGGAPGVTGAATLEIEPLREVSAENQLYGNFAGTSLFADAQLEEGAYVHESALPIEEDGTDLGVVDGLDLFEPEPLEPFAPEPYEPVDGMGDELKLYEGIAPDVSHGVPGPIGLPAAGEADPSAWPPAPDWQVEGLELLDDDSAAQQELAALGEALEDVGTDTDMLLRNAAEAGYRVPEDDEELLLLEEDAVTDEEGETGDGWLGTLLDDDR
jgi:cell division initiation protein